MFDWRGVSVLVISYVDVLSGYVVTCECGMWGGGCAFRPVCVMPKAGASSVLGTLSVVLYQ